MNNANFHIASNSGSYRPVMTNHFEVTIHDIADMVNQADPKKRKFSELDSEADLTLKIANNTFQGPQFNQQAVAIQRGNTTIEFPGKMDAHSSNATFQVFANKSAFDILYSWKMLAGNHETGDVGDPSDYWKKVEIDVMTGNKGKIIGTWTFHNCWISALQEVTFDNGANEVKAVTITLRYFKPQWRNA